MKHLAGLLGRIFKALIFFALFAFALNNQADTTVHWILGWQWTAPLSWVLVGSFVLGLLLGVLLMGASQLRKRYGTRRPASVQEHPDADAQPPHPPTAALGRTSHASAELPPHGI